MPGRRIPLLAPDNLRLKSAARMHCKGAALHGVAPFFVRGRVEALQAPARTSPSLWAAPQCSATAAAFDTLRLA
jgi:hypothetical protein